MLRLASLCDNLLPSPVKTLFVVGGDKVLVEGAIKLKFKFEVIVFEWKQITCTNSAVQSAD